MFATSSTLIEVAVRKRSKAFGELRRVLFSLKPRELRSSQSPGLLLLVLKLLLQIKLL